MLWPQTSCVSRWTMYRSVHAAQSVGLRMLACWDCGFESRQVRGRLSLASVVCCQVEFSALASSLVENNPTDCLLSV